MTLPVCFLIFIFEDLDTYKLLIHFAEGPLIWVCPKVKEESEQVGLKLNIQKMKIMASGPITSWEIDGETVETVADLILGARKSLQMVTAAMKLKDAYSLEGKLWPIYIAYSKAETLLCQQRSV